MHDKSIKINTSNGEFNCRIFGNGKNRVIAFHGFGQDGNAFYSIANSCSQFTIYSFDLPFHGETKIHANSPFFTVDYLVELTGALIQKCKLENFSILAYSIGAKCAYPIIENFGGKIERVWLLAPDGVAENFWYQFATANQFTRYIFRSLASKPNIVGGFAKVMLKLKIVNDEKAKLVQRSNASPMRSMQVYNTWVYFRKLKPKLGEFDNVLKINNIQASIFLGDRDEVIPKSRIEKKCRGFHTMEIITFPCTHNQLISSFLRWIKEEYN